MEKSLILLQAAALINMVLLLKPDMKSDTRFWLLIASIFLIELFVGIR